MKNFTPFKGQPQAAPILIILNIQPIQLGLGLGSDLGLGLYITNERKMCTVPGWTVPGPYKAVPHGGLYV